ncbi:hypothetical protein QSV08_09795 [Maribacter sp. BPC-D8]|uniref:toxin-antitoxin system YwqK family antitoxin n=1 Tax=Maribacter sp. BPC-D8 TaxID=3053613 RepID=UPI002B47C52E|nr:hypothetical protein [Maribacter sp. BPC-D8]WRI31528.1 hypothetical protein QSV08_09795 [Maribacter sp. BPC-D8]
MKNILPLLFLVFTTQITAQKDTLYFDADWHRTEKANAAFFRPLPLEKEGELYHVKDYYINGKPQMDGYWSNLEDETLEGKIQWYHKNGQLTESRQYANGKLNGESLVYSQNGFLRAKGTYKNNEGWEGTFIHPCCFNGYIPIYKEGKRVGQQMYYEDSDQLAQKKTQQNDSISITRYFDKKGKEIGKNRYVNGNIKEGMLATFFINNEDDAIGLEGYMHFENGKMKGEYATFLSDGTLFSKVEYKDDKPFAGTVFNYTSLQNYTNGKLEGEEIGYSRKKVEVTRGINKDGEHWNGQFVDYYENSISSYKEGSLEGKQTSFYSDNLEQVKAYDHILNNDKNDESAYYLKDGKELAKGIYKDHKPWNGTFYDQYNLLFSSFKDGKKHGIFAQYNSNGEILEQQEYENDLLTGIVKSKGYREQICECIYKKGEPYSGEVCEAYSVTQYEKGSTIKIENYERNYENDSIVFTDETSYENGIISAQTVVDEDKTYAIIFKDGLPYNGVHYISYTKEMTTYKNGIKEGVFIEQDEDNRDLSVGGFHKNNERHGSIEFYEKDLEKKTTCIYKKGKPIKGTVIHDHTFTTYKNGLKQGIEKEITQTEIEEVIGRQAEYDKGIILTESYPHLKNPKGEIAKGVYKNGKPYNGDFFKFEPILASFTHYENGEISGAQYVGFNDYQSLTVVDSMQYKSGRPYQGRFMEHTEDRLHFHEYQNGKLARTIVTKDDLNQKIRNTVIYSDTGFTVAERDSDLVMFRGTYLNEEHTKAKVEMYSDVDVSAGTLEFYNNKITAIDINFHEARYDINYALVDGKLVITLKKEGILLKAYPKLTHIEKITYKNFLNPEELFVDGEVIMDTYIDNKHIATGIIKDRDMFDGVHIRYDKESTTYSYYKYNKGERFTWQDEVTKEQLLKLFTKE